jgi:hypothetical protein
LDRCHGLRYPRSISYTCTAHGETMQECGRDWYGIVWCSMLAQAGALFSKAESPPRFGSRSPTIELWRGHRSNLNGKMNANGFFEKTNGINRCH